MNTLQRILGRYGDLIFVGVMIVAFLWIAERTLHLFGGITQGWQTDFEQTSVPLDEIVSGGVGRDGIPPIDAPQFANVSAVESLAPTSPVIALTLGDEARAYPLEVLTRHEIVNDVVNDRPVAVTYCPLCNSAIVYDRRVADETLRFGVSGNLRNSDLIMWDDLTESWWQQFTGESIVGDYMGTLLTVIPSRLVSFEAFRERYPQGQVLIGDQQRPWLDYGRNPYVGYDSSAQPFLFQGTPDPRLNTMERVLAGIIAQTPIAYPFSQLERDGCINDTVNGVPVAAFWLPGKNSALDRPDIQASRDVGMAVLYDRRLEGRLLSFRKVGDAIVDYETGSRWNIFGEAIAGELQGAQLRQLPAYPHLWFAWAAFHPETTIYRS